MQLGARHRSEDAEEGVEDVVFEDEVSRVLEDGECVRVKAHDEVSDDRDPALVDTLCRFLERETEVDALVHGLEGLLGDGLEADDEGSAAGLLKEVEQLLVSGHVERRLS